MNFTRPNSIPGKSNFLYYTVNGSLSNDRFVFLTAKVNTFLRQRLYILRKIVHCAFERRTDRTGTYILSTFILVYCFKNGRQLSLLKITEITAHNERSSFTLYDSNMQLRCSELTHYCFQDPCKDYAVG